MDGPRFISPLYEALSSFFLAFGLFFIAGAFVLLARACLKVAFKATRALDVFATGQFLIALLVSLQMWLYVIIGALLIG